MQDKSLDNFSVHTTRNYVFMTLKTHKKQKKNEIFRMHVSYPKTLIKIDFCSERTLWFDKSDMTGVCECLGS